MFPEKFDDISLGERIFCNRSLNMASIKAIGFDMDYTLALYKHETFEKLAYDETIKKLVNMLGYPKDLLKWQFDHKYMVRGLVIDKKLGNILKIDRHRYVKLAYHGFKQLTRNERRKLYDHENVVNYEEPDFALIDTIFALAEAFLFVQLIEYKENTSNLSDKTFAQIHIDVRKCIDLAHRDGSIKNKIAQHPEKYIKHDPYLLNVLEELRLSGRKIFIVTNSLWDYTNVVMSFLLKPKVDQNKNWIDYFDIIITGSQKPNFFMAKSPLYEVDLKSCLLKNIEVLPVVASPFSIEEASLVHSNGIEPLSNPEDIHSSPSNRVRVFQGGHVKLLHDMLSIQKGSEILYVGDHIYGDILRSKKEIGWRTMLVIEELESEINNLSLLQEQYSAYCELNIQKERLENELERIQLALNEKKLGREITTPQLQAASTEEFESQIKKIGYNIAKILEAEEKNLLQYHKSFHPVWGELMKTGRQNSRFSAQVINYSCLYTSKLSNLRHYGTNKNFQAVRDFMPHDLDL